MVIYNAKGFDALNASNLSRRPSEKGPSSECGRSESFCFQKDWKITPIHVRMTLLGGSVIRVDVHVVSYRATKQHAEPHAGAGWRKRGRAGGISAASRVQGAEFGRASSWGSRKQGRGKVSRRRRPQEGRLDIGSSHGVRHLSLTCRNRTCRGGNIRRRRPRWGWEPPVGHGCVGAGIDVSA